MNNTNNKKVIEKKRKEGKLGFEAKHNLIGFFNLLLKIDMRNNPGIYKKKEKKDDR